ncbi:DUF58 domain-containing protein [Loktanella agnita]|uniref:DUF58 domain-containing protein n=1 Tax=Loktanella agnita TaxID=287097 RepID=UPI003985CDD2
MNASPGTTLDAQMLIAQRGAVLRQNRAPPPTSALPGGFAARKRGQGQVIADSRVFMPGDEMRYVDRGATARTGTLHVRSFHEERDRVTFLVADFRPAMLWGLRRAFRSVAAAEALAWIGWQAVAVGGRVGLLAVTADRAVVVGTRGGTRGMLGVIGGLVRAHAHALAASSDDPPLDQALAGLRLIVPRGADVVIASALDRPGDGFAAVIGNLAQRHNPRFLLIRDDVLRDLPPGHYPMCGPDGQRGVARALPGADPDHISGRPVWPVDAGQPTADAMARVGA